MAGIPAIGTFDATYHIRRQGLLAESERDAWVQAGANLPERQAREAFVKTKLNLTSFVGEGLVQFQYPTKFRVWDENTKQFQQALQANAPNTQKEHVMERQFLAALFIHYVQNHCNKAINMNDLDRFNQLANSQANLVLCPKTLHDEKADFFKDFKTLAEIEAGGKFLRDYLKRSAELFRAEVERVKALPGVNGTPFANHFLTWVLSTPFCNAAMWDNIAAVKWQISLQAATTAMGRVRAEL